VDTRTTLTVVTPAPNQDLVSLEDARDELGVMDTTQDARIQRYISQSSASIAMFTNRVWRAEAVTEGFFQGYGSGGYYSSDSLGWPHKNHSDGSQVPLVLKRYPVGEITGVSVDGTVVDPITYYIDPQKGLLWRAWAEEDTNCVAWGWGPTLIDYTGGYANVEDIPADVQQACLSLVRHRFWGPKDPTTRSVNVFGVQEETYWVGGQGAGQNGAILPEAAGLLAPHIDLRKY